MVSSRSKSPSASNIESLLSRDTEWSQTVLRQADSTSPIQQKKQDSLYSHEMPTHTHTKQLICSTGLVDSHRWVYAVGVRVIDRCWGGAVIHIGWIPACWVWIGCSEPVHTHTQMHTQTQDKSRWVCVQQLPKQLPSACFPGLAAWLRPLSVARVSWLWRRGSGGLLTNKPNSNDEWKTSSLRNPCHP